MEDTNIPDSKAALRRRAEEILLQQQRPSGSIPPEEAELLLHEFKVHQIELEMQNNELLRVQHELEASREKYFALYDLAPVGYVSLSKEGLILEANYTVAMLLGRERSDLAGQPLSRFIYPEDQDVYYLCRKQLIETRQPQVRELRMLKQDSDLMWAQINVSLSQDADNADAFRAVIIDISQKKQVELEKQKLEAQLYQARKMESVSHLTGGIAHDFNNILTAMVGHTYFLKSALKPNDPLLKHVEAIDASIQRSSRLTRSLLAYSMQQVMSFKTGELNQVLSDATGDLQNLLPKNIHLDILLVEGPMRVTLDAGQMQQVLVNLVTNARDAMPGGGILTISTGAAEVDKEFVETHGYGTLGPYATILIADTGSGMSDEVQQKAFEPFFTTRDVGKGMGLAVSYGIVKQHKGFIDLKSKPGAGTTVTIYLPMVETLPISVPPVTAVTGPLEEVVKETVLIAEDSEEVRELLRAVLQKNGYHVIEAVNGQQALKKFLANRKRIRVVLLDMTMPKMNGSEAFKKMKEVSSDLKAVFMSGYTADALHDKTIAEKGVSFLSKPFSLEKLLSLLREALG